MSREEVSRRDYETWEEYLEAVTRPGRGLEMGAAGFIEHRCLDLDEPPVTAHTEFWYMQSRNRVQPRKKNGCLGFVDTMAAIRTSSFDAEWFVDNLHETFRVRPYVRGEFGKPQTGERYLPVVFVAKVGLGQRIRVGLSYFVAASRGSRS